jgi:hypothetical protein
MVHSRSRVLPAQPSRDCSLAGLGALVRAEIHSSIVVHHPTCSAISSSLLSLLIDSTACCSRLFL